MNFNQNNKNTYPIKSKKIRFSFLLTGILLISFFLQIGIINQSAYTTTINNGEKISDPIREPIKDTDLKTSACPEANLSLIADYTYSASDRSYSSDIKTYDFLGNGHKQIVTATNAQNGSGYYAAVLQVFDLLEDNELVLLDREVLQNISGDTKIFNLLIIDIDEDRTKEIIGVGHTGQNWAFIMVYNFSNNILNFEWRTLWYSYTTPGANTFTEINALYADFDDDGTIELLTVDVKEKSWVLFQNTFRFWTVGSNALNLEKTFDFNSGYMCLQRKNNNLFNNLEAADIDSDGKVEILWLLCHLQSGAGDSGRLYAIGYNGTSLTEEDYLYIYGSDYSYDSFGLETGDFDADGKIEILTAYSYMWQDQYSRTAYKILNYSGNQFNIEFEDVYGVTGSENHLSGSWFAKTYDLDDKMEFISSDRFGDTNESYIRIWNYQGGILNDTGRFNISSSCLTAPKIAFLREDDTIVVYYQKKVGWKEGKSHISVYDMNLKNQIWDVNITKSTLTQFGNYTYDASDRSTCTDIKAYDFLGNGYKQIVTATYAQNGSGYYAAVLQIFDLEDYDELDLLDTVVIQNATGNTKIFNLLIIDIDGDGTTEIVCSGHTGDNYAFIDVYNFTKNILNFEWRTLWYRIYGGDNDFYEVNALFADFDDDGTKELLTFDSKRNGWDDYKNTLQFWTVGSKALIFETSFDFHTSTIEPELGFNSFKMVNLDSDDYIEILISAAQHTPASTDNATLHALEYNGTVLSEEASIVWHESDYSYGFFGLDTGDFDDDGGLEILVSYSRMLWNLGDHLCVYKMVNFSGNQFNYEFGGTYLAPGSGDHHSGGWYAHDYENDGEMEFISADRYVATNVSFVRLWTSQKGRLNDTYKFNISRTCLTSPKMAFLGDNRTIVVQYQRKVGWKEGKSYISVYRLNLEEKNIYWTETPKDQKGELGKTFTYDVDAYSVQGIDDYWVNDTTKFAINSKGVITNATILSLGTTYNLTIFVNNTIGNKINASIKIVVMLDATPPEISEIQDDDPVQFGTKLKINCTITDKSSLVAVNPVQIQIYNPLGIILLAWTPMTNPSGDFFNYTWDTGASAVVNNYYYQIRANDTYGNIQTTTKKFFDIYDDIFPEISAIQDDGPVQFVMENELLKINCTVIDNYLLAAINPVQIQIYNSSGIILLAWTPMTNPNGNLFNYTWDSGAAIGDSYYYRIRACDTSGNIQTTSNQFFNIRDDISPQITDIIDNCPLQVGNRILKINCTVIDNYLLSAIDPVLIQIYNPSGIILLAWTPMTNLGGNIFNFTWDSGTNAIADNYYYLITANDTSNNVNLSDYQFFHTIEIPIGDDDNGGDNNDETGGVTLDISIIFVIIAAIGGAIVLGGGVIFKKRKSRIGERVSESVGDIKDKVKEAVQDKGKEVKAQVEEKVKKVAPKEKSYNSLIKKTKDLSEEALKAKEKSNFKKALDNWTESLELITEAKTMATTLKPEAIPGIEKVIKAINENIQNLNIEEQYQSAAEKIETANKQISNKKFETAVDSLKRAKITLVKSIDIAIQTQASELLTKTLRKVQSDVDETINNYHSGKLDQIAPIAILPIGIGESKQEYKSVEGVEPLAISEPVETKLVAQPGLKLKAKQVEAPPKELTEAEKKELQKTEKEVAVKKEEFICIVHKGPIQGDDIYLCPYCHTLYCTKCAKTLKENGESCWSCGSEITVSSLIRVESKTQQKIQELEKNLEVLKTTIKMVDDNFFSGAIDETEYNSMKAPAMKKIAETISKIKELKEKSISKQKSKHINVSRGGDWKNEGTQSVFYYKVKVHNISEFVITNVQILLTSIPGGLDAKTDRYKIENLKPDTYESPTFKLIAKESCVGNVIEAIVTFTDPKGKSNTFQVRPFEIRYVCNLLIPKQVTREEFRGKTENMEVKILSIESNVSLSDLDKRLKPLVTDCNFALIQRDEKQSDDVRTIEGFAEGLYDKEEVAFSIELQKESEDATKVVVKAMSTKIDKLTDLIRDFNFKLDDIKSDTQIIKDYTSQIEDIFEKSEDIEKLLKESLGTEFTKIKRAYQDFKDGKIGKKELIATGLKLIGKKFAKNIIQKFV